jgi:hypothetical protein
MILFGTSASCLGPILYGFKASISELANRASPQLSILAPIDHEGFVVFDWAIRLKIGAANYRVESTSSPVTINLTGMWVWD